MVSAVMDGALLYDMARAGTGDRERAVGDEDGGAATTATATATARVRARGLKSEEQGRHKVLLW